MKLWSQSKPGIKAPRPDTGDETFELNFEPKNISKENNPHKCDDSTDEDEYD